MRKILNRTVMVVSTSKQRDVPLLRKAQVAVSIASKDSCDAKGAESDVTIDSFGPLTNLILKHGFSAHMRVTKTFNLLVSFHVCLILVLCTNEFFNGFSLSEQTMEGLQAINTLGLSSVFLVVSLVLTQPEIKPASAQELQVISSSSNSIMSIVVW